MNERIKNLAEQAGMQFAPDSQPMVEKFADSIIEDCIHVLETSKQGDSYTSGTYSGQTSVSQKNLILNEQISIIRQRFGVQP